MTRHSFSGDPHDMSNFFDTMVDHLYGTFYNKISGTSLGQWIPEHLHRRRQIIYAALSFSAIGETQYVNGKVTNETWILRDFYFDTFRIFTILDDFAVPTARTGDSARRVNNYACVGGGYG